MQCGHVSRVRILYKAILKLHRGLPYELQLVGNNYVKDEFRRNKQSDSAATALFMTEWTNYALSLANQLGLKGPTTAQPIGENLNSSLLDDMSEDQLQQLYELMLAAKGMPTDDLDQTSK